MLRREQFFIDDWNVVLNYNEFKPDGWLPSQPQTCAIWATAELRRPTQEPRGTKTVLLRYPQRQFAASFNNDGAARESAIAELTTRIHALKNQ